MRKGPQVRPFLLERGRLDSAAVNGKNPRVLRPENLLSGHATRAATADYARTFGAALAAAHYSDFLNLHLKLSSLGIGTFPGAATDDVDEAYAQVVERALLSGRRRTQRRWLSSQKRR